MSAKILIQKGGCGAVIGYLLYLLLRKLFPKFVEKGKKTAKERWIESIEEGNQAESTTD